MSPSQSMSLHREDIENGGGTFTMFSKLPQELKVRIWTMSLIPRVVVQRKCYQNSTFPSIGRGLLTPIFSSLDSSRKAGRRFCYIRKDRVPQFFKLIVRPDTNSSQKTIVSQPLLSARASQRPLPKPLKAPPSLVLWSPQALIVLLHLRLLPLQILLQRNVNRLRTLHTNSPSFVPVLAARRSISPLKLIRFGVSNTKTRLIITTARDSILVLLHWILRRTSGS